MAFAFVADGTITEYPVGPTTIRRRFPNVVFAANLENANLAPFGVVKVADADRPSINATTQRVEEGTPALVDGTWTQVWNAVDLTSDEVQAATDAKAASVRAQRDELLVASDWAVLPDSPLSADKKTEWEQYRQGLRDITSAEGFPYSMSWPSKPA